METALDRVCTSCASTCLPGEQFCLFCGDVLPEPDARASRLNDSPETVYRLASPAPHSFVYAGFWLRTWAGAIDVGLEFVVALLISLAIDVICRRLARPLGITPAESAFFTGMAFIVLLTVGAWLYVAFMESSAWRATVGNASWAFRS